MFRGSCRSSSRFRFPLAWLFKSFVVFGFVLCTGTFLKAQDRVELFGGYSYFHASVRVGEATPAGPGIPCPPTCNTSTLTQDANLNGWEFAAQYKFLPFFGGVVDFNGTYGELDGAGTREHTYLLGPQLSLPTRFSPFVHALFGFARESQDALPIFCAQVTPTCPGRFSLGSGTSWASAFGGGLDWDVASFVAVRLVQIDSLHTHLHGASQNQPRVSAGVVLHF